MTNPFDTSTYPQTAPECVVKGRHVGWRLIRDYDEDYTLKYVFHPLKFENDSHDYTVNGVLTLIDGVYYWVFEIPASVSGDWKNISSNDFRWDLILTRVVDDNRAIIETGLIALFETGVDRRTHAEKMLAQIEALLEGKALDDVSSYSIKSRSISKMSVEELLMWRNYYVTEVKRTGGSTSKGNRRPKPNSLLIGFA